MEIAVEIDPLEALVENSATRTRLSKTDFGMVRIGRAPI
jgi:hypothetical protein